MSTVLSEQEQQRRLNLQAIIDLGINPFPADEFKVNVSAADILEHYERDKLNYKNIRFAGRIMGRRVMGSASFMELQDSSGRIQAYVKRDDICPGEDKTLYNTVFKNYLILVILLALRAMSLQHKREKSLFT